MINWKGIELGCKTADLVAADRMAAGRPEGGAGTHRKRVEGCVRAIANMYIRLTAILTERGY